MIGSGRPLTPKEALNKMKAVKGDTLTPYQPDFNEQIETAEGIMKRYKNTLRELAK